MQISITANDYTQTAILAAVKKQQVFADWRVESRNEQATTLSFTKTKSSLTDKECERKFLQQLDDEQLREKFGAGFWCRSESTRECGALADNPERGVRQLCFVFFPSSLKGSQTGKSLR